MLRVSDIMTRDVLVATPDMTLREAAELFAAHHISGAPVVSGTHVVGVVSAADILDFLKPKANPGQNSTTANDIGTAYRLFD